MKKLPEVTKTNLPFIIISVCFVLSMWLLLRGFVKYVYLWLLQLGFSPFTIPIIIGDPINNPLLIEMFFSFMILINMWLFSTRVKFYQEIKMRFITFGVMLLGIVFQFLWNASTPVYKALIPYIITHQDMIYVQNYALHEALFSNTQNLMLFLLALPTVFMFLMILYVIKLCNEHWQDLVIFFKEFKYNLRIPSFITVFMSDDKKIKVANELKEFFDEKDPDTILLPDVALGPNKKTEEIVIQRGKDRTLNNLIIGAIGTGKTAALVLPILNQDLHHMARMINGFKDYYSREDYHTEDVKGRLLNGISVIEPSKDLCDKTFQLVKAHGIPDEVVYYIDPTNPNTPSLNLFKGPTDKVAETFTMVVSGIGESQEFFFEQSQRAHLKNHIYLLKEHEPETDVGFEELINMYNDAQLVAQMHQKLKARISSMGLVSDIEDRDKRNNLLILKGIAEWFDMTYFPVEKGFGKNVQPDIIKEGPYRGQQRVEDKKSEHVVGLRNILNDIASNILLRRVLFGKSDFDFDKHLEFGGILLVNTAKGELSDLSDILGKFVLLSLQSAVFRRKPNDSPYHHILVDEFPDYINENFGSFPAQSRKYKAIITVVAQTVSQLQRKYGPDFMTTLVATLRNKFVYGDGTQLDAEMFSTIFGEKVIFEETETDQEVSALQEDPGRKTGKSYKKTERAVMTVSEMIFQDKFVAAVKLVEDNTPIPAQQVKANFVPKEEFKTAVITVNPDAGNYWLDIRRNSLNGTENPIYNKQENSSFQDTDAIIQDEDLNIALPETQIKKPLSEVNYDLSSSSMVIDQSMFDEEPSFDSYDSTSIETSRPVYTPVGESSSEVNTALHDGVEAESSATVSELMADWLTEGLEDTSNKDETVMVGKEPIIDKNALIKEDKNEVEEIHYVGSSTNTPLNTVAFDDVFNNLYTQPSIDEVAIPIKEVKTEVIEPPKPVIETETIMNKKDKPKEEPLPNPFGEDFIRPISPVKNPSPKPEVVEEEPTTKEAPAMVEKPVDDHEIESYEKRKKEMHRKKIEESRRKLEVERHQKQNKTNNDTLSKLDDSTTVVQETTKVDDTNNIVITDVDIDKIVGEVEEDVHQREHEEWKQQQIKEKRKSRKKTQLGDFGLFDDIFSVIGKDDNSKS